MLEVQRLLCFLAYLSSLLLLLNFDKFAHWLILNSADANDFRSEPLQFNGRLSEVLWDVFNTCVVLKLDNLEAFLVEHSLLLGETFVFGHAIKGNNRAPFLMVI